MRLYFTVVTCFLCFSVVAYGQKIKPLTIGDKVPDLNLNSVLNNSSKTIELRKLKGKIVILDMWNTTCSYCIARFPKMDSLQRKFGSKIQILLVNTNDDKYNTEERINSLLDRIKLRTNFYPSLPIPIHETKLQKYFPHESVPHVVWISTDGVVAAITHSKDVTEDNITSFLNGQKLNLPIKNDWAFDKSKPLLFEGNGGQADDFTYRSVVTKYKRDLGSTQGLRIDSIGRVTGVYYINVPLYSFVANAYSADLNRYASSRIMFDVKDKTKFNQVQNPGDVFCYDLVIPPINADEFAEKKCLQKYLQQDLERYFNVSLYNTKRRISTFVVKFSDQLSKHFSMSKEDLDVDPRTVKKYIHNYKVSQVLEMLLGPRDKPYVDETGISDQKIDIDFPDNFDLSNQQAIIDFLKSIGFEIKEEERELDVVVITDKDK